jgi:tRNA threonylcarbamoyladenosine biosynthesis protein TsaE
MELTLMINSLAEMDQLAGIVAKHLEKGDCLGLEGDLGSGKTTFTKFLAKHLGIKDTVNSPTFTILKVYQGLLPLYHIDVYRLEDIGYDYELEEYIYNEGISVIEWYPYIRAMLPEDILSFKIQFIDDSTRKVTIGGNGRYARIVETISNRYGN